MYFYTVLGDIMIETKISIPIELTDSGSIKSKTADMQGFNEETNKAVFNSKAVSAAYKKSRSVMEGSTGAGARDFSKESQGLGGLVRLYATLAANTYAAGAAFNFLSDAMNTSNMVKGLDQLGAVSGANLGTLAKKFNETAGGALSLRESIEATSKAMTSGMSQKQLLQVGEVAKKASQALGIGIGDAVSRLTRGISKMEPELLDELGLFTKVGKASEDYAKSIGKSAASLTDLERRQAFANAVVKEGIDKFSSIKLETNPYDKLLATLKDISFTGLELVNKVLGPLVSFLSNSPTALALAVGLVAKSIIGSALPAIKEYREWLAKSAETDKQTAQKRLADVTVASKQYANAWKKARLEAVGEVESTKMEALGRTENLLQKEARKGLNKDVVAIFKTQDVLQITPEQIARVEALGKSGSKHAAMYTQLATNITEAQMAVRAFNAENTKLNVDFAKAHGGAMSAIAKSTREYEAARQQAASKTILGTTSKLAKEGPLGEALATGISKINEEKLTKTRSVLTGVGVAATVAAEGVSRAFSVLTSFTGYIAAAFVVYETLSAIFSKNGEEVDKFNSKLIDLKDTTKSATDTNKLYENTLSVSGILAKTTALSNMTDALKDASKALDQAQEKASWFDKAIDFFAVFIGKNSEQKYRKQLSNTLMATSEAISDPALKEEYDSKLATLLKIDKKSFNFETIDDALASSLGPKVRKQAESLVEDISKKSEVAASPLKSLKDGFTALSLSYQEFANQFINKDPLTKFSLDIISQTNILSSAFKNPTTAAAAFGEILKDVSQIKVFSPDAQKEILNTGKVITDIQTKIDNARREIKRLESESAAVVEAAPRDIGRESSKAAQAAGLKVLEPVEALKAVIEKGTKDIAAATSQFDAKKLTSGLADVIKNIEAPLTRALAQAGIDSQKALVGPLLKTAESIDLQYKLDIQSIEIRKSEILALKRLTDAVDLGRISAELIKAEEKQTELLAIPNDGTSESSKQRLENEKLIKDLLRQRSEVETLKISKRTPGEEVSPALGAIIASKVGIQAALTALNSQETVLAINKVISKVTLSFDEGTKSLQQALDKTAVENRAFYESAAYEAMTGPEREAEKAKRALDEIKAKYEIDRRTIQRDLAISGAVITEAGALNIPKTGKAGAPGVVEAAEAAKAISARDLAAKTAMQDAEIELQKAMSTKEIDFKAAQDALTRIITLRTAENNITSNILANENQSLDTKRKELDTQNSLGMLTQQDYNDRVRVLDNLKAESDFRKKLFDDRVAYQSKLSELDKERLQKGITPEEIANIEKRKEAEVRAYEVILAGSKQVYDARLAEIELTKQAEGRQKAYTELFTQAFKGMEDAIVNFTKTGKLSFSAMIDSFIEGLLRFEIQQQQQAIFKNIGGAGGLGKMLAGFIGSAIPSTGVGGSGYTAAELASLPMAKGGAFDYGVQAFAKGDAFTNSIVSNPTLFKFAQGTGLMGEAGPEAIMPLKRDSNGNLGVRGGNTATTTVVVNNYSSANAETKETVDSRGNRKIEVTVGDMVAAEMTRPGSNTQGTLRNTYGLKPAMVRR